MAELEQVPDGEAKRIANIVELTRKQLERRYPNGTPVRRGVHPKDHGCVKAKFTVLDSLAEDLCVGVFAKPGHQFDAWIRFSNAAVNPADPDSRSDAGAVSHGSRGMAVKLLSVTGPPLVTTTHAPLTQDFLMINQPFFAFANVEDYEALSEVLLRDKDEAKGFFARLGSPDLSVKKRAKATLDIIESIKSNSVTAAPPAARAFQPPPVSPVDNRYFSGAPFLFGPGRAMKYSAKPSSPQSGDPDVSDKDYLRKALQKRLTAGDGKDIEFEFQVQVRKAEDLVGNLAEEIENACVLWPEDKFHFETVAKISIPPQDIESAERKTECENLVFSPWHGVVDHRPLGGINRLRLAVYEASAAARARQA